MKETPANFTTPLDFAQSTLSKQTRNTLDEATNISHHSLKRCISKTLVNRDSVSSILRGKIESVRGDGDGEAQDAFFVADMGEIVRQHVQWTDKLSRVEPFYAMKCCPDANVVKTLVNLGTGFDCASKAEIQIALDYGVDPSKIIYANPCKQASHIRYAASKGVRMMTFDNTDELHKIKQHHPSAQLIVRILASDGTKSLCNLGLKFGCQPSRVGVLLETARDLGLDVIGVSFHVGSGCFDAGVFGDAVKAASGVIQVASTYGFEMSLLDVGGGFPCNNAPGLKFDEIVRVLGPAIDALIPSHIRVIAEPGRYYAASAFTLAVNVVARRVVPRDVEDGSSSTNDNHPAYMYYVNDGMYGSFNCLMFDHAVVVPRILARDGVFALDNDNDEPQYACSIWGPTCDSIDCITKECMMPELQVGDWLVFANMGAYSLAAASQFNGFKKSTIIYTNTY